MLLLFAFAETAGAQPANDLCDNALGPLAVPSNTIGTTTSATLDNSFPFCGDGISAGGVWYSVIGTGNTMQATTCDGNVNTTFDTQLNVYCSCNVMTCVAGNDDGSPTGMNPFPDCVIAETGSIVNRASTVRWCSEPNAVYLILVQGFFGAAGDFGLIVSDDGVACGPPTAECDMDGDGLTNEEDNCPDTANPGQENLDSDDFGDACDNCPTVISSNQRDSDGDGLGDACDACPGVDNTMDADGDGVADCLDDCPDDSAKTDPGICGCGTPDTDSDADGTADCRDECPSDPDKIDAGTCGCGVSDGDSDGDGTADCVDDCPNDPAKTSFGACGCGISDADSDGDQVPDCFDQCPDDANKLAAGFCGCGVPDSDSDGDGRLDCLDNCPGVANSNQEDGDGGGVGDACTTAPSADTNPCALGGIFPAFAALLGIGWLQSRRRRTARRQRRTSHSRSASVATGEKHIRIPKHFSREDSLK